MSADSANSSASRHSILELAPLELDCMNALWPSGEATVRQIQEALRPTRPRAYTTIMTILDRLAQKGVVQRRKSGRAWVYSANMSADEARTHAVAQIVEGFFGGSAGALASHLTGHGATLPLGQARSLHGANREDGSAASPAGKRRQPPETAGENPSESPKSATQANLDTALL
jgi:BlaI family transcriptional regulator, penicillinase repressor